MKSRAAIFMIFVFLVSCRNERNQSLGIDVQKESKDSIKAKYLYSADDAFAQIKNENDVVIFEVSPGEEYNKGHLPGAFNVWRHDYSDTTNKIISGMRAPIEEMEQFLSQYGVNQDSKILIYDNRGNVEALRLLWILEMYGHEELMIINGAKRGWNDASLPLTNESPEMPTTGNYSFESKPDNTLLATFEDVQKAIIDTNIILLDTREPYEFMGQPFIKKGKIEEYKPGAFMSGRIINAKYMNWSSMVDLDGDHRFKSIADLEYDLKKAGINKEKEIIVYCQSGTRSSHTAYVLREILGYKRVKNYDGSWIEWSYNHVNNNNVEIEGISIDEKNLLKDSLLNLLNNTDE